MPKGLVCSYSTQTLALSHVSLSESQSRYPQVLQRMSSHVDTYSRTKHNTQSCNIVTWDLNFAFIHNAFSSMHKNTVCVGLIFFSVSTF